MTPSSFGAGTLFGGDYRVVRPLSQGGMGAIYVVEQVSTGKQRALKLMHPQLVAEPELRRRFEQEARIGSRIASEHLVDVNAAGVDAATGVPFLVMELLEGETLHDRVRRAGPLSVEDVRAVYEQLCHAVSAAHAAGIIHRDLKPENVFLARSQRAVGPAFTVKVLDFGIAKLVAEAGTHGSTGAMGSPLWMAPEQTDRGAVTPAADVWALGLIAFFLLSGANFWRSASSPQVTIAQVLREIVLEPIPPASARAAELGSAALPPAFDAWFARCVVREVPQRFPDAGVMWQAMQAVFGAPASTADAHAATMVASVPPMTPNPHSPAPVTPGAVTPAPYTPPAATPWPATPSPYTPPAGAPQAVAPAVAAGLSAGTPPPISQTTGVGSSGGPWIFGSAVVVALAVLGSVGGWLWLKSREVDAAARAQATVAPSATPDLASAAPSATAPLVASAAPSATAPVASVAPADTARAVAKAPTPSHAGAVKVASGKGGGGSALASGQYADGIPRMRIWKVDNHRVRVLPGAVTTNGNIPEEVVQSAIDWEPWMYLQCYEKAFKGTSPLRSGTVTVQFKVLDQLPRYTKLLRSDFSDAKFNQCVVGTVTGQTVNAAGPAGKADVVFPLVFKVLD